MNYHTVSSPEDEWLWQRIVELETHPFKTARGLEYSYRVKRNKQGEMLGEIIFDRKEKTITRATILLAYQKAVEVQRTEGCVSGPKKLGVFGASYLYPIFLHMRFCTQHPSDHQDCFASQK